MFRLLNDTVLKIQINAYIVYNLMNTDNFKWGAPGVSGPVLQGVSDVDDIDDRTVSCAIKQNTNGNINKPSKVIVFLKV